MEFHFSSVAGFAPTVWQLPPGSGGKAGQKEFEHDNLASSGKLSPAAYPNESKFSKNGRQNWRIQFTGRFPIRTVPVKARFNAGSVWQQN